MNNGPNDNVATTVAIGERDGMVVFEFPKPVRWATFDPETARQIGESIAKVSYTAKYGKAPSQGSTLSREIRAKLIARTQHVIRSLQEKGMAPERVANEVLDTILTEIM